MNAGLVGAIGFLVGFFACYFLITDDLKAKINSKFKTKKQREQNKQN